MNVSNQELADKVDRALNEVRPYLETDGGNVRVLEVSDDHVVTLELLGACGSCPMSVMTMKAGIEETIKRQVPEIRNVRAVNITPAGTDNAKHPSTFPQ
jgi:Fe-S cluster biogenesis protein NfuA